LYPRKRYKEALAYLMYGVPKQGGFDVITGEVGAGKPLFAAVLLKRAAKRRRCVDYRFASVCR
jgi:general secretion pathway protein A